MSATVQTVLEEMVEVAFNGDSSWISRDDELLAPHDTMRNRQEVLQKLSKEQAPQPRQKGTQNDTDSDEN